MFEVIRDPGPRPHPRLAVFDFDGTLSLLRGGWVDVMVPMMLEELTPLPGTREPLEVLRQRVLDLILNLNGRPTVYQMRELAEEVHRRGGKARTAEAYTEDFVGRIVAQVRERQAKVANGHAQRDDFLVAGSRSLLEALQARDVELTLASGTVVDAVEAEQEWLGLADYFEERVHGPDPLVQHAFAKIDVMQQLLERHRLPGSTLIGFGDGMVEIQNIKTLGGVAVGVASDEVRGGGRIEPWKRERLIEAGADLIIPDYTELNRLLDWLFPADAPAL